MDICWKNSNMLEKSKFGKRKIGKKLSKREFGEKEIGKGDIMKYREKKLGGLGL